MKNIFDHPSVRRVAAWVICYEGDIVGKIIVAYPQDGAGIVRAQVNIRSGPLQHDSVMQGKAKGYGWDKTSGAVADALESMGFPTPDLSGRGMGAVSDWFDSYGYSLVSVL